MTDQLIQQLRILKLSGMREHLEGRIQEAERNDLSYGEFLSMIVSDEVEMRTNRRISRLLHHAGLGAEKTLETFDFGFAPSVNAKLIKSLATCRFIEHGEGIFLLGPTGTGKTHLAKALAHAACRKLLSVGFYSFYQLFAELTTADLQNRQGVLMKRLLRFDRRLRLQGYRPAISRTALHDRRQSLRAEVDHPHIQPLHDRLAEALPGPDHCQCHHGPSCTHLTPDRHQRSVLSQEACTKNRQ
jgi:hypothetical protein